VRTCWAKDLRVLAHDALGKSITNAL